MWVLLCILSARLPTVEPYCVQATVAVGTFTATSDSPGPFALTAGGVSIGNLPCQCDNGGTYTVEGDVTPWPGTLTIQANTVRRGCPRCWPSRVMPCFSVATAAPPPLQRQTRGHALASLHPTLPYLDVVEMAWSFRGQRHRNRLDYELSLNASWRRITGWRLPVSTGRYMPAAAQRRLAPGERPQRSVRRVHAVAHLSGLPSWKRLPFLRPHNQGYYVWMNLAQD